MRAAQTLLAPIWRQNEHVRQARQRRRRPSDVNPDTGAPLDVAPVTDLGADALPA